MTVTVLPGALYRRPDLLHYDGATGIVLRDMGDGYVAVFWRGLGCTSIWRLADLSH